MNANARQALERLRAGNARYAANEMTINISDDARRKLVSGQAPFAVVLGCSDSRVPTEVVFDQGVGDLFVIRIAGNIVQPSQIGSVEFAVQKFGTELVVVLGHSNCGAIQATIEALQQPAGDASRNLAAIISRVQPAVEGLLDQVDDPDELMRHAVRENVRYAAESLRHGSSIIESLIEADRLSIVGAEYSLETGLVDFFDGPVAPGN
ncbi:MAG: carbonic anhydrase [Woeseiaceae bacterium]|nr:carbonic anhydrase [Woeseiaceae bacterium]